VSSFNQVEVLQELNAAVRSGDADTMETAVRHAYEVGLSREFIPSLLALLPQRSHTRHEDIVSALQKLKDPNAVDALYEAALVDHDYLSYDEFFGLARKCTWALADIGTREARHRLGMLAQHTNPLIAAYAQKRLDLWDDERDRKG
jgi:hypothetical protein